MTEVTAKRGRKALFETKQGIVKGLRNLETLSYPYKRQLCAAGYLEVVKAEKASDDIRGRHKHLYQATGKARGLLAISKNWKV